MHAAAQTPWRFRTVGGSTGHKHLILAIGVALLLNALTLAMIMAVTGLRLAPDLASSFVLPILCGFAAVLCYVRDHPWRSSDALAATCVIKLGMLLCSLVTCMGLRLRLPLADPLLASMDSYSGISIVSINMWAASSPLIAGALQISYEATVSVCFLVLLCNYAIGDRHRLWHVIATGSIAMQLTSFISLFLPARGSTATFNLQELQGAGLPLDAGTFALKSFDYFYFGQDKLVQLDKLNGIVCFPSFHTVLALMIVQGTSHPILRQFALAYCVLTLISTIPIGGHYIVDILGGALVWLISMKIGQWACRSLRSSEPITAAGADWRKYAASFMQAKTTA